MPVKLGKEFALKGNKIVKDTRAVEMRMDLCTRLKRKNSKRVKVKRKGQM